MILAPNDRPVDRNISLEAGAAMLQGPPAFDCPVEHRSETGQVNGSTKAAVQEIKAESEKANETPLARRRHADRPVTGSNEGGAHTHPAGPLRLLVGCTSARRCAPS